MLDRFRYILLFYISLFSSFSVSAQLAMPDNVCVGGAKHYYVDINPVLGSIYTWKIDGVTQLGSITNEIDITWNTVGNYLLEVQELPLNGCPGPIRSGQVFVGPIPTINAGVTIQPTCSVSTGSVVLSGLPTGNWTINPGAITGSTASTTISGLTAGTTYNYTVTNAAGCTSDPLIISIIVPDCDFNIPKGFSPNDDGINDKFVIRGIDRYPNNTIIIYNRWGNKVFEASPYQNTWDGRSDFGLRIGGDQLPDGTYFCILDLGDGSDIYKSYIYIKK